MSEVGVLVCDLYDRGVENAEKTLSVHAGHGHAYECAGEHLPFPVAYKYLVGHDSQLCKVIICGQCCMLLMMARVRIVRL